MRLKITKGTINFILRKDSVNAAGLLPIQMRYSYRGKISSMLTGYSIHPQNWDEESKECVFINRAAAKRLSPDTNYNLFLPTYQVQEINAKLQELELKVKEIENIFDVEQKEITAKGIIAALRSGGEREKPKDIKVIDLLNDYIDNKEKTASKATIEGIKSLKKNIVDYEIKSGSSTVSQVTHEYLSDFSLFLASNGLLNSSIKVKIAAYLSFLRAAQNNGIEINERALKFKWSSAPKDVIALTRDELNRIEELRDDKHEECKDVFLFMCYTGLRISDVKALTLSNIKDDHIVINVTKTKQVLRVPLIKRAEVIIDKYRGKYGDKLFKRIHSTPFNLNIKGVAKLAGLDDDVELVQYSGNKRIVKNIKRWEQITAHVGRRTFVTISLELGMTAEEVMAITGHKSYASFQRYVNVTESRKRSALNRAWDLE